MADLAQKRAEARIAHGERWGVAPWGATSASRVFARFALLEDALTFANPEGLAIFDLVDGAIKVKGPGY